VHPDRAPPGSTAELKPWLDQGPLLMDGARWFSEGDSFAGIGYDGGGVYIRDSGGKHTRYLTWSQLYGDVGFSGWVVGVLVRASLQRDCQCLRPALQRSSSIPPVLGTGTVGRTAGPGTS